MGVFKKLGAAAMKLDLFNEDSPLVRRVVASVTADHNLTYDERVLWLYLFDHRDSNAPIDGYLPFREFGCCQCTLSGERRRP